MNRTVYFLKSNQTKLILNRISVFFKNPTEILKNLFHTSLKATQPKAVENDAFTRLRICLRPHVTLTFDLLHRSCCDTMGIYHNVVKIHHTILEISRQKGIFSWPPDPQSWLLHALALWTTRANCYHNQFICFQNIMFTGLLTDKRIDERTQRENITSLPASLA